MKYLVIEKCGLKFPVLFPDAITHSSVAHAAQEELGKVLSAGFVDPRDCSVSGASQSLDLCSDTRDSALIRAFLRDESILHAQFDSNKSAIAST